MTPRQRRISAAAALATAIAIPAEGLRQYAYYDPPGILTVCYGHTGSDFQSHQRYSLAACKAWLDKDMMEAVEQVERCHPGLPDSVLAAFGDAVYNLGPRVACSSTASRMLSEGDIPGACAQLKRWDKARIAGVFVTLPGLTKRRQAEYTLCVS